MIDDILGEIFGEVVFGKLGKSRRVQLLLRVFFGLLGAALGVLGAFHFAGRAELRGNAGMRLSMISVFVFLACFSLFNVGLGRTWRWPGRLLILSLVMLFAARIFLGP